MVQDLMSQLRKEKGMAESASYVHCRDKDGKYCEHFIYGATGESELCAIYVMFILREMIRKDENVEFATQALEVVHGSGDLPRKDIELCQQSSIAS